MLRICAWCKREMGTTGGSDLSAGVITHGICLPCYERFFGEIGDSLQEFLETLEAPVLVADDDVNVIAANRLAEGARMLKPLATNPLKSGDFISCVHAAESGGCGKTSHCKACAIRRCVEETFATGRSQVNVRAYAEISEPPGPRKKWFYITTEKAGDCVLLRIENVVDDLEATGRK